MVAVSHNNSDNASTKIVINNAITDDSESDNNSYIDIGNNSDSMGESDGLGRGRGAVTGQDSDSNI